MTPADPTELDELESGLTSGFWQRFAAHVEQEWGPAGRTYQLAVQHAIGGPLGSEAEAVQRLKLVAAVQDATRRLLQWPTERVAQIKMGVTRRAAIEGPSRRGPGL